MSLLNKFLDGSYMPHGHCLAWQPDLLFMHVGSDIFIALAYFSIPAALTTLALKRPDLNFNRFFILFSLFIFGCGTSHIIETINIWHGYYYLEGMVKVLTASVSVLTAIAVWPIIPKLLRVPSFEALEVANSELRREIERRERAELELSQMNKNLEDKVQERTYELEQSNEVLTEFAYRTSHDLRSPLVSSISLLDVAVEAVNANDQKLATSSLTHTKNSLNKLEALVRDILLLTQATNEDEQDVAVDIEGIVDETLDKFVNMENYYRLTIQKEFSFDGKIKCKISRFRLIMENLISNAIKYQDKENSNSKILISSYQSDDNCIIEVRDNGLGIPDDQRANLFGMFKRFHPKISYGSGLGLYMMKKSAEIMGADIAYCDSPDGSIFKLTIPVKS